MKKVVKVKAPKEVAEAYKMIKKKIILYYCRINGLLKISCS